MFLSLVCSPGRAPCAGERGPGRGRGGGGAEQAGWDGGGRGSTWSPPQSPAAPHTARFGAGCGARVSDQPGAGDWGGGGGRIRGLTHTVVDSAEYSAVTGLADS